MAADWSTLPLDLLAAIAMKLESFEDFIYFSAVCRWWNCVSSLIKSEWRAPLVPWLLLAENTEENPDCFRKIFNLTNNKCYELNLPETFGTRCFGSAYGWVVVVHPNFSIQLFNPITKSQICFPSLESLPTQSSLNAAEYYIDDLMLKFYLIRLMVIKVSQGDHDEFVIVILYDHYSCLAFARHDNQSWTSVFTNGTSAKVVDVVGVNDNVFALYDNGAIEYWNVKEFQNLGLLKPMGYLPPAEPEIVEQFKDEAYKIYLVQSGSDLLMVLRYKEQVSNSDNTDYDYDIVYKTLDFRVYRLDHKDKSWKYIEDLGDVALFVGNNFSICVSSALAKGLQPSCIYFTDDEYALWSLVVKFGGYDMGVFNNISGKIWRFYEGDDTRSKISPPTWFIPSF